MPVQSVRAKFYVKSKQEVANGQGGSAGFSVELCAVYESGAPDGGNAVMENRIFGKNTPSGTLVMFLANHEAAGVFEVGKPYYLDFYRAPA